MLKLIGSLCIVAGSAIMGIKACMRLSEHVDILYGLIWALETIESEIRSRLAPVPTALHLALQGTAGKGGRCESFLKECLEELDAKGVQDFRHIWCKSVDSALEILPEAEKACLKELAAALGAYGAEEQSAMIGCVKRRLEAFLKAAELEKERSGRIYATLGVTIGIAVVIVMM